MTTLANNTDEPIGDDHLDALLAFGSEYFLRLMRSVGYAFLATVLIYASNYELNQPKLVILAIGSFGLFAGSARIGQIGLGILMVLATVPKEVLLPMLN